MTSSLVLLLSTFYNFRYAVKGKRAAKNGDWPEATYYTVMSLATSIGIRAQLAEMRRKGLVE